MKRFLLYAFTYILMTVSVAFGTVTIDSLIDSGNTTNSSVIVQTPAQESVGDKLLNNLLSMGGAEVEVSVKLFDATKQKTITTNSQTEQEVLPDIDIAFNGNINISSLDDIKLNGTLYLKMQDTEVNLDIAFLNNTIYVSNETLNIKLETSSIGKVLELLPILGINLDIGLNLEDINVNDLMGALQNINEERVDENTLKLTLNLFDTVILDILCDNEYNVTAIEAEKIELANYIIDINAGLQKNAEVEIESPEITTEKEFVDVTKTLNIVDSVKEIVTNEKLHLNLDAGLKDEEGEISVSGTVDIDFSNEILVYADLNLNLDGSIHNLQVGYINSNIYISFNGLKFMVKENAINETIDVIGKHFNLPEFEQNILLEIAKLLPGFELGDVLNGDFSNINIDNLLEFSKGEDNVVNVTVFGDALNISSDIKVAIMLDQNDQFQSLALSGIQLLEKDLYAVIEYTSEVAIPEMDDSEFLDFNNLPNLVDAAITTVKDITENKVVELNLNTVIYVDAVEISVVGDLVIDFSNENIFVYANLDLTVLEKTINLQLQVVDNVIYVELDNLKLSYAVSDISELIEVISNELNISTFGSDINALTSIFADGGVVGQILQGNLSAITSNLIKEFNITNGKCYIVLDKSLINTNDDIKLDINFDSGISGIELTGLNFNSFGISLSVDFANGVLVPKINATEYTDLKYTKNLVSAVLSTVNSIEETIALDVNLDLTMEETIVNVNGTLAITGSDIYANLTATIGEIVLPVEVYLIENKIYLQIAELKVFTTIDNISQIVSLFGEDAIDVTALLSEVFPKFDLEQILNGNLSTLSLDILKSLTINENDTTIVLSNEYIGSDTDISLKVNYTDKLTSANISGINMFGLGLTLSADMNYDFVVPTLNESSYNNLSYVYEAVNSILNTVNTVIENKEATLNLNANAVVNGTKYLINGLVYVNFANATTLNESGEEVFDINGLVAYANIKLNLNGTNINISLNLQNGYAFVEVFDFKVKVQIESITELITTITSLLPEENQLDVNELLNTYLADSVLLDVLNEDYSTISLGLIKSITTSTNGLNVTLDKSLLNTSRDVIINITYNNNLVDYIDIFNLNLSEMKVVVNAQLNYTYKPATIDEASYFELSGIDKLVNAVLNTVNTITEEKVVELYVDLALNVKDVNILVNGNLVIDFSNEKILVYSDLDLTLLEKTIDLKLQLRDDVIYVDIDNLKLSYAISDIEELVEFISTKLDMSLDGLELGSITSLFAEDGSISKLLQGDLSAITSILDLINNINISDSNFNLVLDKSLLNTISDVAISINYNENLLGVALTGVNFADFGITLNANLVDSVVVPQIKAEDYADLKYTKNLVSAILETVNAASEGVALDLNANLTIEEKLINLAGTVSIKDGEIYANLTATIDEIVLPVEVYLVENTIYLTIDELRVFTTIDNVSELVALLGEDSLDVTNLLSEVLPKFDFEQILNGNLSTLSLDILKSLTINESDTTIVLSNEYIGSDTDISLKVNYNETLTGAEISGINMFGIGLELTANMNYDFAVPALNVELYNDLSCVYETVNSVLNTVNSITENKEIALDLNLNATIKEANYNIAGLIYVNFANAVTANENDEETFDINGLQAYANINLNLDGANFTLQLDVQNGYAYVNLSGLKVKIQIESVTELITTITSLLPEENQLDVNELLNTYLADSVLLDVLNEDYSTISLSLIKSITTTKEGLSVVVDKSLVSSLNDISIAITYQNDLIDTLELTGLNISEIDASLNAKLNYTYEPAPVDGTLYFELSGANSLVNGILSTVNDIMSSKVVALNINDLVVYLENQDIHVSGYIYVDFANATSLNENGEEVFDIAGLYLYADLNIKIFDKETLTFNDYEHNINVLFDGTNIYVSYNTLKVSVAVSSINEVIDVITKLADLNKSEMEDEVANLDIVAILSETFPGMDFEALLSGDLSALDLNVIKYLNIVDDSTTITLNKDVLGVASDITLNLTYAELLNNLTLSGLNAFDISLDLNATFVYDVQKPTVDASQYSNLDSIADLMNSVYNTGIEVNDNKNIAFSLSTSIISNSVKYDENDIPLSETKTTIVLSNSSFAKFDWGNAYDVEGDINSFNIEKLSIYAYLNANVVTSSANYVNGVIDENSRSESTSTHEIEITYINNVLYVRYNKMKVRIDGEGIALTIDTICDLLGLDVGSNSFDNLMGLVTSIGSDSSLLEKIKVEMIKAIALTETKLTTTIDIAPLELGFGEEFNILNLEVIYNPERLEYLSVKDLSVMGLNINSLTIGLTEFTPVVAPTDSGYMNMSSIGTLLDAVKNTLDFTDFTIQGNVNLKLNVIGINLNWDIPLSIQLKLVDGGFEGKIVMGPVPVVTGVNDDAPYLFGNTVDGINPGEDRILTIYLKDNFAYFHRTERVPAFASKDKIYEKKLKIHMETLLGDPLYYLLQYGLGFSDAIMDAITGSLAKERTNPLDFSNILTNYTDDGNGLYTLTLNMVELTENPQLDTMSVGVKVVEHNGKNIVGGLTFNMYMPLADGVEITLNSTDITHANVGEIIDFSSMYSYVNSYAYKEGAEWDAYNSDWQLSGERKFTLSFVTNSSETIAPVEGVAGSRFVLPTPASWTVDNGETCTTYEFAGWYTTKTFDAGTEYAEDIMPRSNKTIYAKWTALVSKYVTIAFEENGGTTLQDIKILEGANLTLPSYLDLLVVETENAIYTKQFDGWYVDAECTTPFTSHVAPTSDITLYALWTTVDMAETYELSIYDNGEKIATKYLFEGALINLSGSAKFNATTKYYTDANCTNEYTSMVMPNSNFELYIKNEYSLTLVSNYGNVVNSKLTYYQGYNITLPAQKTYSYDDGTQTECVTYTFDGYFVDGVNIGNITSYTMPNKNVTIEARWTVDKKVYFTVTFNTSFKKPGAWNADSGMWGTMTELRAPSAVSSIRVLEDTTFTPSADTYSSTCRYKYKAVGISKEYEFKVKAWNTSEPKQLSYNSVATSAFTEDYTASPVTITDDTILYAVWYYVG